MEIYGHLVFSSMYMYNVNRTDDKVSFHNVQGHVLSDSDRGIHRGKWYSHNGQLYSGIQMSCEGEGYTTPKFDPEETYDDKLQCYGRCQFPGKGGGTRLFL